MPVLAVLGLLIGAHGALAKTSVLKIPKQAHRSQSAMDVKYSSACALLNQANAALAVKRYSDGDKLLDQALHVLGDDYTEPQVDDDTGMKLVAAMAEAKKGHPDIAANLKRRVLESRLELFRARHLQH
jgi:hypothetical protein